MYAPCRGVSLSVMVSARGGSSARKARQPWRIASRPSMSPSTNEANSPSMLGVDTGFSGSESDSAPFLPVVPPTASQYRTGHTNGVRRCANIGRVRQMAANGFLLPNVIRRAGDCQPRRPGTQILPETMTKERPT